MGDVPMLAGSAEWFDDRFYKINMPGGGEKYIASVTTKLGIESKPFLYKWYAELGWEQARRKLNEAGERGKRIHYAWYIYNIGGAVLYNPPRNPNYTDEEIKEIMKSKDGRLAILGEQSEMVDLWKLTQFVDIVRPQILHNELTVFSIDDDIAGTLDNALHIEKGKYLGPDGKVLVEIPVTGIYLTDLKSGNTVPESAWAQTAAYSRAYDAMGHGTPAGSLILHTGSTRRTGIKGFSALVRTADELIPHLEIYQHLSKVFDARNPNMGPTVFQFPTRIEKSS